MAPIDNDQPTRFEHEGVSARADRWVRRSAARYYEATLQVNLFGEWEVLNVWGGIGSRQGGHRCLPVAQREAGLELLEAVGRRREKRGYERASPISSLQNSEVTDSLCKRQKHHADHPIRPRDISTTGTP